jgi:hypothetical protein
MFRLDAFTGRSRTGLKISVCLRIGRTPAAVVLSVMADVIPPLAVQNVRLTPSLHLEVYAYECG